MFRTPGIRLLIALATLMAALFPVALLAQDDPNEVPLGDVARNLRKNAQQAQPQTQAVRPVIDDDNLTQVMDQADNQANSGSTLRYIMSGGNKGFLLSAPDVTCSLAFTGNVKSLLASTQYSQMELPVSELPKLEGPATIEGDTLTITLFNATTWHVSEVAVALTVVKRNADASLSGQDATLQQVRPEKKQDTTVIYKMRAAAPPWMRAAFSAPLNLDLAPGDEWHWAIVQARGYPPQTGTEATTAANDKQVTTAPVETPNVPQQATVTPVSQQTPQ